MNASQFITKWSRNTRTERAASQSHFNDLCALSHKMAARTLTNLYNDQAHPPPEAGVSGRTKL